MSAAAEFSHLADLDRPWLGLESFREDTRAYFFGRKAEIAELHLRLSSGRLLLLYGRSGLGKTSLLRAGLIPELLEQQHRPLLYRLSYEEAEGNPCAQIIRLLGEWEKPADFPIALPDDTPSRLWLRLHQRVSTLGATHLFLDQFEEVFTLGTQQPGMEDQVRDLLALLVQGAIPPPIEEAMCAGRAFFDHFDPERLPLRLMLAMRDDYVYALNRWQRHLPLLGQNNFELRELRGLQAFDAVYRPGALRCAYRQQNSELIPAETGLPPLLNEDTARRIIRFIAGAAAETPIEEISAVPPILSLLCRELNERRFTEPPGTLEAPAPEIRFEETTSNVASILATFYERCLDPFPEAVRIFIEDELVSVSGHRLQQDEGSCVKVFQRGCDVPGAVPPRRAVGFEDSVRALGCLSELVNFRLLSTIGGDENRRFELTHDLLARTAVDSRTAREARLAQLEAEARALAETKLKEDAEAAQKVEHARAEELQGLKDEAERGELLADRRLRWARALAVLVLVALVGATYFWYQSRKTVAKSEELLHRVGIVAQREADRELLEGNQLSRAKSIGHLIRAARVDKNNRAAIASLWAQLRYGDFAWGPIPGALGPLDFPVYQERLSPTGEYLVYQRKGGPYMVRTLATGKDFELEKLSADSSWKVTFSRPHYAIFSTDNQKAVVDLKGNKCSVIPPPYADFGLNTKDGEPLSPDGKFLLLGDAENRGLYALENNTWSAMPRPQAWAWHPTGQFLAVAPVQDTVEVVRPTGGPPLAFGNLPRAEDRQTTSMLIFSPDGRFLLVKRANDSGLFSLCRAEISFANGQIEEKAISFALLQNVNDACWLYEGATLQVISNDQGGYLLDPKSLTMIDGTPFWRDARWLNEIDVSGQVFTAMSDCGEWGAFDLKSRRRMGRALGVDPLGSSHRMTSKGWQVYEVGEGDRQSVWSALPGPGPALWRLPASPQPPRASEITLAGWRASLEDSKLCLIPPSSKANDLPALVGAFQGSTLSLGGPDGGTLRIWSNEHYREIPWNPPESIPEVILPALEVLCGWRDDDQNGLAAVPMKERVRWRDELIAMEGRAGPWQDLFKWWIGGRRDEEVPNR